MSSNHKSYFGDYGGQFVSELLIPALQELEETYFYYKDNVEFLDKFHYLLEQYAGRPTNLYFAENLSKQWKCKVYIKREDLLHTGAHKINNTLGQTLLTQKMGKKKVIAETGAGQHGVATATAAALFKMKCTVYMGEEDTRRQALNVYKMKLLGAEVIPSGGKSGTLRHAVNEALRDWSKSVSDTHYILGSVVGPHPFPTMVRDFVSVIGREAKEQIMKKENKLPDAIFACVGGGSNAMGIFHNFVEHEKVKLFGVEAGGYSLDVGHHSSTISKGSPGILHGTKSYLLQDDSGQVSGVHSVSAGLDYPGVGPEHSYLNDIKRANYVNISDKEALNAFQELTLEEGIIPALESSHAVAYAKKYCLQNTGSTIIINLSGRGDKDVAEVQRILSSRN